MVGIHAAPAAVAVYQHAVIAQLGERQTEDLKVPGSIPGLGTLFDDFRTDRVRNQTVRVRGLKARTALAFMALTLQNAGNHRRLVVEFAKMPCKHVGGN